MTPHARVPPGTRETRPVLYLTYAYDEPDDAPVLDVSGTLEQARKEAQDQGNLGCPCYRVERLPDDSYGNEQFMEFLES